MWDSKKPFVRPASQDMGTSRYLLRGIATLLFILCGVRNLGLLSNSNLHAAEPASVKQAFGDHEIARLFYAAQASYNRKVATQSRTLPEARREYQKRYGLLPPEGFDDWFAYAKKIQSPIIDDFDGLMRDLEPWRSFQQASCDLRLSTLREPALLPVCFRNGILDMTAKGKDVKKLEDPFRDMVAPFAQNLPDLCFFMNTFDEPRHLLDRQVLDLLKENVFPGGCSAHKWDSFQHKSSWNKLIKDCPSDSPARQKGELRGGGNSRFIQSWDEAIDICSFRSPPPSGLIHSPQNLLLSSGTLPIISFAGISTSSDVLAPCLWRWRYDSKFDDTIPWSEKKSSVGWRGSSTGGYATNETWRKFQRHRFVALAAGKVEQEESTSAAVPGASNRLRSWLDARFTGIVGCEETACKVIEKELPPAEYQATAENFRNKIVLDMDGHGFSGRFYQLLQSGSAVLKQGLIKEWHDDRVVPWLHYIPLSMEASELEDMLAYFFGTDEGDQVLAAIARAGKDVEATSLRKEDMRLYMYRLMLELGRRSLK